MVMVRGLPDLPAEAIDEVWGQLCGTRRDEDAAIGTLLIAAIEQCEDHVGYLLIERECRETRTLGCERIALSARPVIRVLGADRLEPDGLLTPIAPEGWSADGIGADPTHFRLTGTAGGTVRIRYRAGVHAGWDRLSPLIRTGIVKLAAHWHGVQQEGGSVPETVIALWRGERQIRL